MSRARIIPGFWLKTHRRALRNSGGLRFRGILIHWRYEAKNVEPQESRFFKDAMCSRANKIRPPAKIFIKARKIGLNQLPQMTLPRRQASLGVNVEHARMEARATVADDKVASLGGFMERALALRDLWKTPDEKELWFRGEDKWHPTFLRPELYRPGKKADGTDQPLKPVADLLKIENDLYGEFQRCAVQLRVERTPEEDWDWDSYFLMQHHGAPTRLLDWSDGALMALHFAVRNKSRNDAADVIVYAIDPLLVGKHLDELAETKRAEKQWKAYVKKHPLDELEEGEPERVYLPASEEELKELSPPSVPMLLDFPHITRRVAAQRSRFLVFGTDPSWLAKEAEKSDRLIKRIIVDGGSCYRIRRELRESGVTESVIFPDLDGLGREMRQLWLDRR